MAVERNIQQELVERLKKLTEQYEQSTKVMRETAERIRRERESVPLRRQER